MWQTLNNKPMKGIDDHSLDAYLESLAVCMRESSCSDLLT